MILAGDLTTVNPTLLNLLKNKALLDVNVSLDLLIIFKDFLWTFFEIEEAETYLFSEKKN